MKQFIFVALLLIGTCGNAQVSLPYFTGFDNAAQQSGWTEYKKAATTFSHWGFGGGYTAPNAIGHDYSPSTGISLTDNWFVSPGFSISSGGMLDSIRYKFSGFSVPQAGDTIGIYLLNGAQDPSLATSQTLLFDFRNTDYVNDYTYHVKTNIALPPLNGTSYFAVRYRNTNCSAKWLTVSFDNIALSGNATMNIPGNFNVEMVKVYPNPSSGKLFMESNERLNRVEIKNIVGETVYTGHDLEAQNEIDLSGYAKGMYIANVLVGTSFHRYKIILR